MRVLIVDECRAMRMFMKRGLRQARLTDVEVVAAVSGPDALRQVREDPPDLVLCVWNMPGMAGLELLEQCREEEYRGRFGLVASVATSEDRMEAVALGANFVIGKPVTAERLLQVLETDPPPGIAISEIWTGPDEKTVGDILSRLLNRRVEAVGPKKNRSFRDPRKGVVATFMDAEGLPSAIVIADLQAAYCTAAALTLMPKEAIDNAVKGDVSQEMSDNLRETFDVLSKVLKIDPRAVTLETVEIGRIKRIHSRQSRSSREQAKLRIEIPGYGGGIIGLYAGVRSTVVA